MKRGYAREFVVGVMSWRVSYCLRYKFGNDVDLMPYLGIAEALRGYRGAIGDESLPDLLRQER